MKNEKQNKNDRPTLAPPPYYELTVLMPEKQVAKKRGAK